MEIKLKQSGRIFYRHPDGPMCIYDQDGARFYAERGKKYRIVLYALDDGTFTEMRLTMSKDAKFTYSRKFKSYQRGPGPITIKGHYPFFVACEKRKRPIPVYLDIDGKFYRDPVHNFKERLKNKPSVPRKKKYVPPVLDGEFFCQQCHKKLENVKSATKLFCSDKCTRDHRVIRSEEDRITLDLRTNYGLEEAGFITNALYYVCILKISPRGYRRLDWIGGPYEGMDEAERKAKDPEGFMLRYRNDYGWSPGHYCVVRRLTTERETIYGHRETKTKS